MLFAHEIILISETISQQKDLCYQIYIMIKSRHDDAAIKQYDTEQDTFFPEKFC